MASVTNNSAAKQGVRMGGAKRWIAPGETRSFAMSDDEIAAASRHDFLVVDTGGSDLPALSGKNKAELLAIAEAEGVTIEDGATNADIVSAVELHREG